MSNEDHRERDTNLAAMILAYQGAKAHKIPSPKDYARVCHDSFRGAAEQLLADMEIHDRRTAS